MDQLDLNASGVILAPFERPLHILPQPAWSTTLDSIMERGQSLIIMSATSLPRLPHTVAWVFALGCAYIMARLIYILIIRPRLSSLRHLPAPHQGPAVFRLLHEPSVVELEHWLDTVPHDGLIRYYGLWNEERIFAASPEAVKQLLVTKPNDYVKPRLQFVLAKNIAAEGLLIQEGQAHKGARKAYNPAYNPEQTRKSYQPMYQVAGQMLEAIERQTEQETPFKAKGLAGILKPVSAGAIDIVGRLAFSRDFNSVQNPRGKGFGHAYVEMFKTTPRGQWTLDAAAKIGPELALRLPLRAVKTIKGVMAYVRETAEDIVAEHEAHFKADCGKESSGNNNDDTLTTLMRAHHFEHDHLVDQTVHILAAATETVSGSIAWAIHLLSRYPHIQQRVRDEIRAHLPAPGSDDATTFSEQVFDTRLPYFNAVIKEVLRYHSINTILWRESVSNTASILGHSMPVGTKIIYSPWASNRDPRYWGESARVFDPERWLTAGATSSTPNTFLTFGAGTRRCVGEQYARVQMRCVIAALVGRFDFQPQEGRMEMESDEGQEIGSQHPLTLFKILEGWNLRVTRVEGW